MDISIVIITYNAQRHLDRCLSAVCELSDDLIIVDAHSTDDTPSIAGGYDVTFVQKEWIGYGKAKNHGASLARYDWILSIDADEICSPDLINAVKQLSTSDTSKAFTIKRINHICDQPIRYGHLKPEYKVRLYHRDHYRWDDAAVHEQLTPMPKPSTLLSGCIYHYSVDSIDELREKYLHYAHLHPRSNAAKALFAPLFHFLRCYVLQLGFLEGRLGWLMALARYEYTRAKYQSDK